ncbi:hypothetical protein BHM03_00049678 [Ensete ventricosum]|nr:hypothetical protein BHM03_00049678 [Ensete ventricosum]
MASHLWLVLILLATEACVWKASGNRAILARRRPAPDLGARLKQNLYGVQRHLKRKGSERGSRQQCCRASTWEEEGENKAAYVAKQIVYDARSLHEHSIPAGFPLAPFDTSVSIKLCRPDLRHFCSAEEERKLLNMGWETSDMLTAQATVY